MGSKKASSGSTALLFSVLFFIFGAVVLYYTAMGTFYGLQSPSWPTAQATITTAAVEARTRRGGRRRHRLTIEYTYEVNGRHYTGDKARYLENMFTTASRKREIAHQFPAGSRATVYYHPQYPNEAVLIPGPAIGPAIGGVIVGLLFCVLGGWGLWRRLSSGGGGR